jgi:TolA-binding protein
MNLRKLTATFMLTVFASACVTTGRVNSSRGGKRYVDPTGVKTIDDDVAAPAGVTPAERVSLETYKTRIAVLEGELEESRALHQRDITTLNDQVRVLTEENARLKGDLETSSRERVTEDTKKAASLLWQAAAADLAAGKYNEALPMLKQLVDRYPEDPHAYYAHTATAMALYSLKRYSSAAGAFAFVAQKYPTETGIQMSWYGQGAGLYKMLKGSESLLFFKQTASRWASSAEGRHAAQIVAKKSQPGNDLFLAFPNWLKDAPN